MNLDNNIVLELIVPILKIILVTVTRLKADTNTLFSKNLPAMKHLMSCLNWKLKLKTTIKTKHSAVIMQRC